MAWCSGACPALLPLTAAGCAGALPAARPHPSLPSRSDLLQNPLLVPVKVLKGHALTRDLGVLDIVFHPTQPWIFSSGADGTVRLFT